MQTEYHHKYQLTIWIEESKILCLLLKKLCVLVQLNFEILWSSFINKQKKGDKIEGFSKILFLATAKRRRY